ncbi:putative AC transposase [Sesamum angolense]|uniref:AC transposase n=1 Tax=Sesamum angolense TaxID=2727404 RepID=A0AAE1VZ14_9LAMI|nr:putative AC transposase [Sesamum angolense]
MSNYGGIGSHSQSQSNSSPNAQTVNMDESQNQVSGDRLENVEHYFNDNIDKEMDREDEEDDVLGDRDAPLVNWRFEQDKTREALCHMLVVDELPFKLVEHSGFRHFLSVACPMFDIPSRRTITKDIFNIYVNERARLKSFIKDHAQRVCITTDTWTSIQKVNYMCLTAHFIDDDWNLHKRILNFCPIIGHKSEEIGKGVEKCLLDWGIDRVFSIIVDNASSNDGAIVYLKKKFENWGQNILGGRYVHMRCMAHIVNLVMQDGLKGKDEHEAISRIRGAIRYIRNSPARWNSTYLMLETAISLKIAFDAYEEVDLAYKTDLSRQPFDGIPIDYDWERAKVLAKFLRHFYNLTLRISGALYVTSNLVFREICEVDLLLRHWLSSNDVELIEMARKMKEKYDKYWGSIEKMNMILYYAVILDPRHKLEFIEFTFDKLYGGTEKSDVMKEQVRDGLYELFNDYKLRYGHTLQGTPGSPGSSFSRVSSSSSSSVGTSMQYTDHEPTRTFTIEQEFSMYKTGGKGDRVKSELEKYLGEDVEMHRDKFDILNWWKVNTQRFPILSKMARDVLAVPVSTVASESAFSTGGRVLDAFRSSLSPKIVQALICTQDWLRKDSKPISIEEDLSELEVVEKGIMNPLFKQVPEPIRVPNPTGTRLVGYPSYSGSGSGSFFHYPTCRVPDPNNPSPMNPTRRHP